MTVPLCADQSVPRPALWRRLDQALGHGSVAVTGPAGSGKTHLLGQWWCQAGARPRAWLTLDDADRDPVTFLHSLLQAVSLTEEGKHALTELRPPPPGGIDPAYLRDIALATGRLPEPVVVVLDDVHRLTDSPAETLLTQLLHSSPEPLRLVLLSRGPSRLGLERGQFGGWLDQLTAADLALTVAEVEELIDLRPARAAPLSASDVWQRTRGWVLGTLVEVQELPAGRRRTVLEDYFDAEVLTSSSPADRPLVERAVTVDPVCGPLLDVLLHQESGGAEALEALHRAGLFLEPTGPDGDRCDWYRWQPQFRTVLAERLGRRDPRLARDLHRTAVRWLQAEGRPDEAADHALSAGDRVQAAEVLSRDWLTLLHTGRLQELDAVLARFTEDERATRPELSAACAVLRSLENDLTRSCRCAEQAMTTAGTGTHRGFIVEAASAGVHLYRATLTGVEDHAPSTARRLLAELESSGAPLRDSELALQAHLAHLLAAWAVHTLDLHEALRLLQDVVGLSSSLDDPRLAMRSTAQMARVDANTGHLTRAMHQARAVLEAPPAASGPPATVVAGIAMAESLLLRGQPLDALSHLSAAQRLTAPEDAVSRSTMAMLTMTALLASGQVAAARERLESLREELLGSWSSVPVLESQLLVAEARQLLAEGSPDEALRLLPEPTPAWSAALSTRVEVARVRAGYLLHDPSVPEPGLVGMRPPWTPDDIAALVMESLVAHRSGRDDRARGALETALQHSSEERVALPFLLMATELRPLLRDVVAAGTAHEGWALALIETMSPPPSSPSTTAPYVEPLTPRELEVLRALQGTLSAEDIAARLFVSMNTLRTHVKHINRKLGTGSRREAVARARELALL